MRHRMMRRFLCTSLPVEALLVAGSIAAAQQCCPPPCAPAPWPAPAATLTPPAPGTAAQPERTAPPSTSTAPGSPESGAGAGAADTGAGSFGGLSSGAGVGASVAFASPGGYVDDAIPQTLFRLRNDAMWGFNRFDRATFFFDTWREGNFHSHAFVTDGSVHGTFFDPKARGPQIINTGTNLDELSAYLEVAVNPRFSVFVDLPYRSVHLGSNQEDVNESPAEIKQFPEKGELRGVDTEPNGISDTIAGFKYAFVEDPGNRYFTFMFRSYFPTGDPGLGLGTNHYTLEPGLLLYQRLSERFVVQGEFMDWIPISGGNGAGSVLTYGAALGYDLIQRPGFRFTPVAEVVGWTVLGGTEAVNGTVPATATIVTNSAGTVPAVNIGGVFVPTDHFFANASGDTIVNFKLGVRTYFGDHSDLYVGYGHCVTGSRWYEDIFRVEYRYRF